MREIKFRAWDVSNSNLGMSNSFCIGARTAIFIANGMAYEVDVDFVTQDFMQYTGLKDKNGKEIYEGDICRVSGDIYEIIYCEESASFRGRFYKKPMEHYYLSPILIDFEVIGNIYQDKHLLEAK